MPADTSEKGLQTIPRRQPLRSWVGAGATGDYSRSFALDLVQLARVSWGHTSPSSLPSSTSTSPTPRDQAPRPDQGEITRRG
ncbi:MAG: hypothetical protein M5U22_23495, partial [Thermoleophilia bacterium]|nr:hypothetical protein [Thermoleophilia bacterium]